MMDYYTPTVESVMLNNTITNQNFKRIRKIKDAFPNESSALLDILQTTPNIDIAIMEEKKGIFTF